MQEKRFSITNKTRNQPPRLPWLKIKETVLGKDYCLSLVFIGQKKSKELNSKYRRKNKPTNILSFPLDKKTGEIFITPKLAKGQERLLFIHGLLHLKGMEHGSRMKRAEKKYVTQYCSRNRYRNIPSQGGSF